MKKIKGILSSRIGLVWALLIVMAAPSAMAEEVYLRAMSFDKDVPDGSGDGTGTASVPMWGYALCTGTGGVIDGGSCGAPTSPGPTIEVTEGQNLTIYVDNQLPALTNVITETSVLIPALPKPLAPVRFPVTGDPSRDNRIYSFDAVTANAATGMYEWTAPTPGTYLYHSATHPQVQVQMGLYGAVIVRANTTPDCTELPCAYSDVPYDQEAVVVFSEIDPALHTAVAADTYNTPAGPTSTEVFVPRFFLINGEAFPHPSLDPLFDAGVNGDLLVRTVNAGIENRSPQILGEYFEVIAEDGHRKPTSRQQLALMLPAGKTKDVLLKPGALGTLTLFDRRLRTVNDMGPNGGMFARISVTNTAPIADAGPDQNVNTGETVTLDGSGSSDANGDPLTYTWSFVSVPGTSTITDADLTPDANDIGPEFIPDAIGDYVVQLIVNDGTADSTPDTVTISTAPNTIPVADAGGPYANVPVGSLATLDGSASSDAESPTVTYAWTFTSVPAGSALTDLVNPTSEMPEFTPDVVGDFMVQLIVNDGIDDSLPVSVTIVAENTAPIANAGPDQLVALIDLVQLDGSASSDPNGDTPLLYSWMLTTVPVGSTTAILSDSAIVNPTFQPDVIGTYVAELIVNDGLLPSPADQVTIEVQDVPPNTPPVANAGPDETVELTAGAYQLNGSGSDADGDPIVSYSWTITSVPGGSAVTTGSLSDPTIANPTFTPDVIGDYVAELVVGDGMDPSAPNAVTITVQDTPPNTPPAANAGTDQTINLGETAQLAGSGSDADGDPIATYSWTITTVPAGSTVTTGSLSNPAIAGPSFVPDVIGDYVAQLIVNDGTDNSPADTVTISVIIGTGGGTGPFEQTGGLLSMEAEHFATNTAAGGVGGWIVLDPVGDASNTMAIKAAAGAQTYTAGTGSSTTYEAQLEAGTHYVWARFRSFSSMADSFYFQFDGGAIQLRGLNPDDSQWHWIELATPITVGTADVYTMTVYRRERDMELDKLVITTDTNFDPATVGGGLGPVESPRVGGGGNTMPVANAGPDQTVDLGQPAILNGAGSGDADGDPLSYSWTITSVPGGSAIALGAGSLVNADMVSASFVPDVVGAYNVQLIVNDGLVNSIADMVTITAQLPPPNTPPVANAGLDQNVTVALQAQLNGSGSDADGDPIVSYSWTITSVPGGSAVTTGSLSDPTIANPTFTPDVIGDYVAELIVSDGMDPSIADAVTITAAAASSTGPFVETGGVLSMEAEHLTTNTAAGGAGAWIVLDPSAGASNAMAIKADPGVQTYTAGSGSSVTYQVQLDAGLHYLWARFRSFSGTTDSFYFQLDGGPIQLRGVNPDNGVWTWLDGSTINVGTAGLHTLTIYRRERDLELDKLILTTNPALNPATINGGLGPDESPRL